jgi:hypothetical protein
MRRRVTLYKAREGAEAIDSSRCKVEHERVCVKNSSIFVMKKSTKLEMVSAFPFTHFSRTKILILPC